MLSVRAAEAGDAAHVTRIFNEGVADRVATFQAEPARVADFAGRIGRLPLLVADADGLVVGWSGVLAYSVHTYHAGVGEYQVYIERAWRGRGAGRLLLEAIVAVAEEAGYWKLVGRLFADNHASVALAHRCGFRDVGVHQRHGRLDGVWRDVLIVERLLGEAAVGGEGGK